MYHSALLGLRQPWKCKCTHNFNFVNPERPKKQDGLVTGLATSKAIEGLRPDPTKISGNIFIKFTNRSNEHLHYWSIDEFSKKTKKWSLPSSKSVDYSADISDNWVITKESGSPIALYTPPNSMDNHKHIEIISDDKFQTVAFFLNPQRISNLLGTRRHLTTVRPQV